ncbi:hypothetical protein GRF29_1g330612 [Pseudopithomyces chartarum]|uniref:Acyl-CoA dehydrogenase/oxidase C-terminal domain-containing protein n=1 Tax=Pseudopithomyces chartarum TaxID=1892770 RepID=A0AAN6M6C1_9PLEO|nr:hypothetical protein GRF29_1g330612 [Pseudopithomyces chartarum]
MSSETMNFSIPPSLQQFLTSLDSFIETQILPLQHKNDNIRFFDHRREHARTDWDAGGLPHADWEALLAQARDLADTAGFYRTALPVQYGGRADASGRGTNLWMAVIREHLAAKGLGLFNDLQNEHSVVGNFPDVVMVMNYGNERQKEELIGGRLRGEDPQHAHRPRHHLPQPLDPHTSLLGPLHHGLPIANTFTHENRLRQAASSLGAATYCVRSSILYSNTRRPFGTPLSHNQAIQFPLVELHTQIEMLRLLIRKTALEMDAMPHAEVVLRGGG